MQVSELMTRDVVAARPGTTVKQAAGLLAEGGFAALPVVAEDGSLVGIVAEADVLRDRLPTDPRLHLRRDEATPPPAPLVGAVMTTRVRSVPVTADVAEVAALLVGQRLRSVPVLGPDGRLAGIVSRRDLLRPLARPDDELRTDVLRLVGEYTGAPQDWAVQVHDGIAVLTPGPAASAEDAATVATLARTVPGIVAARVAPALPGEAGGGADSAG